MALAMLMFAGCAKEESNTIKIGGIFPLSGDVAVYGVECRNGVEMAISEINANGGVKFVEEDANGNPVEVYKMIELVAEDDEGNPEKSVNAYKKLVTKDKVNTIVGSLTSGCTAAITSLAQAQKVLMVAPAATMTSITDAGDYVFRACFIDPFQGTVGGKFAAENLGKSKAAVLYDITNDYSVGLYTNFKVAFEAAGGKVVAEESYAKGDMDFNAQLTKIKNANPDVVYLPDYYATVALIAKQLRAQGINTPIVGADGWDGLTENAGDEVLNGYYSNHYAEDSDSPAVQKFVGSFKAKYNKSPNSFAALGYDSVYMLKDAILKAGTTDGEKVRAAFETTDGDYVTGHITFDEKRNPVKSAVMIQLVKDGDKLSTKFAATVDVK